MMQLFKNELIDVPYRSFIMVDVETDKFTLYREYKSTGEIEILLEGNLKQKGWSNAYAFIASGAGNRVRVSYEAQKHKEHVNYVTQACLLRDRFQAANDEFTRKRIIKLIKKHSENAAFFGLSPDLVNTFCVKENQSLYGQEAQHGFRIGENYRRRRKSTAGFGRGRG